MCGRRQMAGSFHCNARFAAMMATFDLQWHMFIHGITVDEWTEVEMELDQDPYVHNVDFNDDLVFAKPQMQGENQNPELHV